MGKHKKRILQLAFFAATYLAVAALIRAGTINDFSFAVIVTICINIILSSSLNMVTGFAGQFSLGHAGFMSIGAYVCALTILRRPTPLGFLLGMLGGALLAALVGLLVGLPTLRLRGDYLAIATLGMAEIIRVVFLNLEITNGAAGLSFIPQLVDWNWLFAATAGTLLLIANFLNSSPGRACIAIQEDEVAAEAVGVNTLRYKVTVFSLGAFFAGIGGALYAAYFYFIKPDLFGFSRSVDILVIVVVGGMGSLSGSVVASVLLMVVSTALQAYPALRMILYSLLLVAVMLFRPQGLMGSKEVADLVFTRFRRAEKTEKQGG
ncbi:MAG: branched-chain amino acid ABC transporter permease [Clostridiales bacterium]|nr:branched-chain amino acid ABC transporter permease [Clostridiales bacterium]